MLGGHPVRQNFQMGEFPWTDQHTDQQSNFTYNYQIVEIISLVLKTGRRASVSWVRIPHSPAYYSPPALIDVR